MKSDTALVRGRLAFASGRLLLLACAAHLSSAAPAFAQSVDYSSMEQVFGEPITTSATGSPQRVTEAPADMSIVTQDDIRRSGADNLPDILALVPGVEIARNSFGDGEISVRGYNTAFAPRLLVLLNGRPVFDDFYAYVPWGAIPVELTDIRQIEIVRGPSTALFGFNAAAGVINIITFDPLYDKVNSATVATGTQGLAEGSAVATAQKSGVWGLRLSAGGIRANEFAVTAGQAFTSDHPLAAELSAEGRYLIRTGMELTVEAGVSNNAFEDVNNLPITDQLRIDYQRALLATQTGIGQVDLSFYRTETRADLATFDETDAVYDGQLSDTVKLGASNILRGNLEYRNNQSTSPYFFQGTYGYRDFAASLMWNWQITPALSFTNAIRFDRLTYDYTGTGLPAAGITHGIVDTISHTGTSFNSGLVWTVTPKDTLRLLLARGLQLPSLDNAGHQTRLAPGVYFAGDPHLAPTAVTSVELAYDRTLTVISSTLRAAIFAERNDNLAAGLAELGNTFVNNTVLFRSANVGHSDEEGLELGLKGSSASGLRWNVSYDLAAITDHLHQGLTNFPLTSYARSTPRHTVLGGLGYNVGRWEFDTSARWQSHYSESPSVFLLPYPPQAINGFLTVNGRVAYDVTKNFRLSVSGDQFLRARIVEAPGLPVERRVIVSLTAHL